MFRCLAVVRGLTCLASILLMGLGLAGCGGGGSSSVTLLLAPATAEVPIGSFQKFTATVKNANNTGVIWSVREGVAGGSITSAGIYTPPTTIGTYHVVATSQADRSKSAAATVVVQTLVTITPATVTVPAGGAQTFVATVQGSPNTGVIWNVVEGTSGGTINAAGVYSAPAVPGVYHITATSKVDSSVSSPAIVTVQGGTVNGTIN